MPLDEVQKKTLFDALQEKEGDWREDVLYAPSEGFWLMKSQPSVEDLQDFHKRMVVRLERIERNRDTYTAETDDKNVFANTADLVEVLQKIVDDKFHLDELSPAH